MESELKVLLGRKQMEEVQSMLKALEEGNTSVFREDRTLVLPHNIFNDTVMNILKGDMEG